MNKGLKLWVPVPGFSKYEVNADRVLRNSKGDEISQKNKSGKYYITKDDGGKKLISMDEIMELVGDAVNGVLTGDCETSKELKAKAKKTPAAVIKTNPKPNKNFAKGPKVAKAKKAVKKKEPKKATGKKTTSTTPLTMVQIKKVLDAVDITSNATVIKVEKILNLDEPKHAKCYRLMLLGIKNKTISELTNTPAPAVGRNIWFYTSGKYELS